MHLMLQMLHFFISSSIPMGVNQTRNLGLASATFRTTLVSYKVAMKTVHMFLGIQYVYTCCFCIMLLDV